jgi:hypothetical protein
VKNVMLRAVLALAMVLSLGSVAPARPAAARLSPGLAELTALEERCRPWHAVLLQPSGRSWAPARHWLAASEAEAKDIARRQAAVRRGRYVVEPAIGSRIGDALVIYESGGHPWSIGVNASPHQSYTFATKAEAVAKARSLIAAGFTNLDLGLHQLNTAHLHGWLTVETAFDPCVNVNQGGLVWASAYSHCVASYGPGAQCVELATRAYNSGSFYASQGYAQNVWGIAAGLPPQVGAQFPVLAMVTGRGRAGR